LNAATSDDQATGMVSLLPFYTLMPQRHPIDRCRTGCGEQLVRLHEFEGFHAKAAEVGRAVACDFTNKWKGYRARKARPTVCGLFLHSTFVSEEHPGRG
jgi:hypothetical protein